MSLPVVALSLVLVVHFSAGNATRNNEFESANGCQQYNADTEYTKVHPYFDTSKFTNVKTDDHGVTRLRIGVLGKQNAYVRFTSVSTNTATPMTEIALAHWWNTRSDVQKYTRTIPTALDSVKLASNIKNGLMSIFEPVMMTLEIRSGGRVTVTKDGDNSPFFTFTDSTFSYAFMGICKWDDPVVLFYDCPLLTGGSSIPDCESCMKIVAEHRKWLDKVSQLLTSCDNDND